MVCGTVGRPCPKVHNDEARLNEIGPFRLPPPCIYLFPATIPSVLLRAFHECFGGRDDELSSVAFEVENRDADLVRKTKISRGGQDRRESSFTAIRRFLARSPTVKMYPKFDGEGLTAASTFG